MNITHLNDEGMIVQELEILPADLIFTPGMPLIRWFQRGRGEEKTFAGHVAGIGMDGESVLEALWTVTSQPYLAWAEAAPRYEIWRHYGLSPSVRGKIASKAESYRGRDYGWWKLFGHAGDAMLTKALGREIYLFRQGLFLDNYPICSWHWAYPYNAYGIDFGIPPRAAAPDHMHDHVRKAREWGCVVRK